MKAMDIFIITFMYGISLTCTVICITQERPDYLIGTFLGATVGTGILIDHLKNRNK